MTGFGIDFWTVYAVKKGPFCLVCLTLAQQWAFQRGGGYAALLRFGSAPGPKAPSCVSAFFGSRSAEVCSLSEGSLSEGILLH